MTNLQDVTELPPLTAEQRDAIRNCRFSTTNTGRSRCWLITNNEQDAETLRDVTHKTEHYCRDWQSKTYEWELSATHPEIMLLVSEIMAGRKHVS